jgi:hypothetical protein
VGALPLAGARPRLDLAGEGVLGHRTRRVQDAGLRERLGGPARIAEVVEQHRPSVKSASGARGSLRWPATKRLSGAIAP